MNEREMLRYAAIACGELVGEWISNEAYFDGVLTRWNPLTDSGDALRLAVRASIDIVFECGEDGAQVACAQSWDAVEKSPRTEWVEPLGNIGDESNAAVRRAIVRAAAEIGKAMP